MLTQEEIEALVLVLQRAPLTKAEALAINAILQKMIDAAKAPQQG